MTEWVYSSSNDSLPDLKNLLDAQELSFDIEGTGVDMGSSVPIGFSLACSTTSGYYSPIESHFFRGLLAMKKLCIAHNASYDRSMLKKTGVIVDNLADTMIAAHLLQEPKLSLRSLTSLPVKSFTELSGGFVGMDILGMASYSCPHSMAAFGLWIDYKKRLKDLGLINLFLNIEMPLVSVISDMELNGVAVDKDVLDGLGDVFDEKISPLKDALDYWSGEPETNYNSPEQIAHLFYDKLKIPPHKWMKTKSGRPTTLAKYLEQVRDSHPIIPIYLAYKQLMTLKNSYVKSLSKDIHPDGRVYGKFNQTGTRTGRLSSSDPNLQKIPQRTELGRRIREAFVAPRGKKLLAGDYDILELKMLAICSGNPYLLDAFKNNRDIHTETAKRAYGDEKQRPKAKTLNYQVVYGGGSLAQRGMFFTAYPGVDKWIKLVHANAREAGYVRTMNGRIRSIEEYNVQRGGFVSDRDLDHGDREVLSTRIQGSSAEAVKVGMRRLWEKVGDSGVKMVLQAHDEVLLEVPEDIVVDVAEVMKEQLTIREYEIPLTVTLKVGDNWGNMHKLDT